MTPTGLNSLGLVANMAGVAVAFFYGFPQPSFEEGAALGLQPATRLSNGKTVAERDEEVRGKKRKYLFRSRVGLVLMGFGFALQFIATSMM